MRYIVHDGFVLLMELVDWLYWIEMTRLIGLHSSLTFHCETLSDIVGALGKHIASRVPHIMTIQFYPREMGA